MSSRSEVDPHYPDFNGRLEEIHKQFGTQGTTIHKARNELKVMEIAGIDCVVKAFRIPNIINQFAYAYIRRSKAYKSYHNARKLTALGVATPEPIAYIEFYDAGLLQESLFISRHFAYDFTLADVRDTAMEDKVAILEAFARYTYDIHQKGVWHVDYSGGNILVSKHDTGYAFSLVDINRMEFRDITGYEGLENFNKLWLQEEDLKTIARAYASVAGLDADQALEAIIAHDQKLKAHVLRRRKIKAFFKGKS